MLQPDLHGVHPSPADQNSCLHLSALRQDLLVQVLLLLAAELVGGVEQGLCRQCHFPYYTASRRDPRDPREPEAYGPPALGH